MEPTFSIGPTASAVMRLRTDVNAIDCWVGCLEALLLAHLEGDTAGMLQIAEPLSRADDKDEVPIPGEDELKRLRRERLKRLVAHLEGQSRVRAEDQKHPSSP